MSEPITTPAEAPAENPPVEPLEVREPVSEPSPNEGTGESDYQRQLEQSQRELESARLELLKRDLCAREGLPPNLVRYVSGENEAAILDAIRQVREDFSAGRVGVSIQPGKQNLGPDADALSPMEKITVGLQRK